VATLPNGMYEIEFSVGRGRTIALLPLLPRAAPSI
jgi:hypothetical protein